MPTSSLPPAPDARLPTYTATRFVVPLREGGSLPAILDTEEAGLFVAKFRGAGQGARALLAELICGQLAALLDLPVPDVALLHLDPAFGRTERDPEIQDILKGSHGLNMGLRFLEGAFNYDPVAVPEVDPALAAAIVWFDAFLTNVDRTPRNPNLLVWRQQLWMIDHGAALYFHHNWATVDAERAGAPFPLIRDHVLLPFAEELAEADARLAERLDAEALRAVLEAVPDALYMDAPEGTTPPFSSAGENRAAYLDFLTARLRPPRRFAEEAARAREALRAGRPEPKGYRR